MQIKIRFTVEKIKDGKYIYENITHKTAKKLLESGKYYQAESITLGDLTFLHEGESFEIMLMEMKEE